MVNNNDSEQKAQTRRLEDDAQELQESTRHFIGSLFRAGVSVALVPVNMLPQEPREHFQTAGREFTRGLATLVHAFADSLEKMTQET